jgi:hypothetical protein
MNLLIIVDDHGNITGSASAYQGSQSQRVPEKTTVNFMVAAGEGRRTVSVEVPDQLMKGKTIAQVLGEHFVAWEQGRPVLRPKKKDGEKSSDPSEGALAGPGGSESSDDFEARLGMALAPMLAEVRTAVRSGEMDTEAALGIVGRYLRSSGAVRAALGLIAPAEEAPAIQNALGDVFADTSGGSLGDINDWIKRVKDAADAAKKAADAAKEAKGLAETGKQDGGKDGKGTKEKPKAPPEEKPPHTPGDEHPKLHAAEASGPYYAMILDRVIDHKQTSNPAIFSWAPNVRDRLHWVATGIVTLKDHTRSYSQLGSDDYELESLQEDRSDPWNTPLRLPDYGYGKPKQKIRNQDNILAMKIPGENAAAPQTASIDWTAIPDSTTETVQISFDLYETSQPRELKTLIGALAQLASDLAGSLKGKSPGQGTAVDQATQNALKAFIDFIKKDDLLMAVSFTFSIDDLRNAFSGDPDLELLREYAPDGSTVAFISKAGFNKARSLTPGGLAPWAIKLSRVCGKKRKNEDIGDDEARALAWQTPSQQRTDEIDELYSLDEIWLRIERRPPLKK